MGLPDPGRVEHAFPHELSGGMLQRVMIAMALSVSPRLLIADEPTTALDVTIQQQILELVEDIQARTGMAVVWVTHDLGVVARIVDHVVVMYAGRVVESAPTRAVVRPAEPSVHTGPARFFAQQRHRSPATSHPDRRGSTGSRSPWSRVPVPAPVRVCNRPLRRGGAALARARPRTLAACWRSPDEWPR